VKWGIGDDPKMEDRGERTVLATGFDVTLLERKPDQKGKEDIIFVSNTEKEEELKHKEESTERIAEVYGADKVIKQRRNAAKLKYAVLKPSQFDDHEVIAMIESAPTYNREPRFNEELQRVSEHNGISPRNDNKRQDSGDTISFDNFSFQP